MTDASGPAYILPSRSYAIYCNKHSGVPTRHLGKLGEGGGAEILASS